MIYLVTTLPATSYSRKLCVGGRCVTPRVVRASHIRLQVSRACLLLPADRTWRKRVVAAARGMAHYRGLTPRPSHAALTPHFRVRSPRPSHAYCAAVTSRRNVPALSASRHPLARGQKQTSLTRKYLRLIKWHIRVSHLFNQ